MHLAFVAITFIFILLFIILIPAFVSRQFSRSIRNSYLIYRVYPNKYSTKFVVHVIRSTLSFGGVLIYAVHIFLLLSVLWWADIQEDRILVYTYTIISLVLYVTLFGFSIWTLCKICKQLRQRQHNACEWQKQGQAYFRAREFSWFVSTNNFVSFFWIASVYGVWLYEVSKIDNAEVYGPFALGAPLIVTMAFNLISGIVSDKTRYLLAFSSVVVFMIITMWPGGVELSRKAFRLLGIGGEIPVEIAVLPGNKLGLLEGVIRQSEPSGSIYGETLGPFRLILYGKEKIYLSTMTDQECLPERAGTAPANASCQRIFSIRTEYVASVDTTKSLDKRTRNSPDIPR